MAALNQSGGIRVNKKQIAVLSNNGHSPWLKRISEVLGPLGKLTLYSECTLEAEAEPDDPYDLILVDASGLQMELAERVAWVHGRFPDIPIVVLTSSPTWRRARAVLQAGASDYMRRSTEDEILLQRCRSLMHRPP